VAAGAALAFFTFLTFLTFFLAGALTAVEGAETDEVGAGAGVWAKAENPKSVPMARSVTNFFTILLAEQRMAAETQKNVDEIDNGDETNEHAGDLVEGFREPDVSDEPP
jgi:hypothetical protein